MNYNTQLLDGMVIFVEVLSCGSFTQAAQNSGHSTSYISKEINKLESRLGVRLLNRTTRSLSLTPEGEVYLQHCQQIISDAQHVESLLSGHQLAPQGTLKISCPSSLGISRIQPILVKFIEQYPEVNLELDVSDHKVDMIAEGFDVLIRASGQLDDSSLISRRILRSQGVTIASPAYLEKHGTPRHPAELDQHQILCYSNLKQPKLWIYHDKDNRAHQVKVESRVLTNSSEMEIALCIAGQGITRMPRFNLKDELESGQLVELFTDYQRPEIDVYVIYPSRKHMSSKVRRFIDFVVEAMN